MNGQDGLDPQSLWADTSVPAGMRGRWSFEEIEDPRSLLAAHRLFEEQAGRTPAGLAIREGEEALTYAELDQLANRFGRHLRAAGVDPRNSVVLCLDRSIELVAALLAVWKAGAAAVLLSPFEADLRLEQVVMEVKPAAVIRQGSLPLPPSLMGAAIVDREALAERIGALSAEPLGVAADLDRPALHVVSSCHESGQITMALTHVELVGLLGGLAELDADDRAERMGGALPFTTTLAVLELLLPLTIGAEVLVSEAPRVPRGSPPMIRFDGGFR